MEEEQDKLLTARDVAFRLRVSTYTLSNWRYAHQGPPWVRGKDMDADQIAKMIEEKFPDQVLGTVSYAGQVGVKLKKDLIQDVCRFLHDEPSLRMDHLADLTAVDYSACDGDPGPRFEVVYNMISPAHRHRIRLKVRLVGEEPRIDTVTPVWNTANWHERETYDLMGVVFAGHPDLRRILL